MALKPSPLGRRRMTAAVPTRKAPAYLVDPIVAPGRGPGGMAVPKIPIGTPLPNDPTNWNAPIPEQPLDPGTLQRDIVGDFEYQGALGDVQASNAAAQAAFREQMRAAAVGWGGDLSALVQQGLIDRATAQQAAANQTSTMADLQRTLTQGIQTGQANLAARGVGRGGAAAVLRSQLGEDFQRRSQAGLNSLINAIKGGRIDLASQEAERNRSLASARASVANRLLQTGSYGPTPATTARWDPSYGGYVANGRVYDVNGRQIGVV